MFTSVLKTVVSLVLKRTKKAWFNQAFSFLPVKQALGNVKEHM